MISEEKAKELIIKNTLKCLDSLGYGKKVNGAGCPYYIVKGERLTFSAFQEYCVKKELKKFGIKY